MIKGLIEYINTALGNNYIIYNDTDVTNGNENKIEGVFRATPGTLEKETNGDAINQIINFTIQFILPIEKAEYYQSEISTMINNTQQTNFNSNNYTYFVGWLGITQEGNIVMKGIKKHCTLSIHGQCSITNAYMNSNDLQIEIAGSDNQYKLLNGVVSVGDGDNAVFHSDLQVGETVPRLITQSVSNKLVINAMCMNIASHKLLYAMKNNPNQSRNLSVKFKWGKIGTNEWLVNYTASYVVTSIDINLPSSAYVTMTITLDRTR